MMNGEMMFGECEIAEQPRQSHVAQTDIHEKTRKTFFSVLPFTLRFLENCS